MYDELVKRLREEASSWCANCCYKCGDNVCGAPDDRKKDCDVYTKLQAADAIEELSKRMGESIPKSDAEIIIEELSKPRWIPVKERLPEEMDDKSVYSGWSAEYRPSDDVQVYLASEKRQSVAWYSHTYNEWTTVDENTVYEYGEVTHWKPLSEPPEEE